MTNTQITRTVRFLYKLQALVDKHTNHKDHEISLQITGTGWQTHKDNEIPLQITGTGSQTHNSQGPWDSLTNYRHWFTNTQLTRTMRFLYKLQALVHNCTNHKDHEIPIQIKIPIQITGAGWQTHKSQGPWDSYTNYRRWLTNAQITRTMRVLYRLQALVDKHTNHKDHQIPVQITGAGWQTHKSQGLWDSYTNYISIPQLTPPPPHQHPFPAPEVHLIFGETVVCATISLHLYVLSYIYTQV